MRGQGTLAANLRQHELTSDWSQCLNDCGSIFVAQNREQNGCTLVVELFPPRLRKNSCARGIVRAVDNNALIPDLKAGRPFDRRETVGDCVVRERKGRRFQRVYCDCRVDLLMFAVQCDFRFRPRVVNELQRCVTFLSAMPDNYFRLRSLRRRDNGNAWLYDSRFFLRNLANGITEPFLVVEIDWGNDADRRLHRVRGIESSAHASLEYQNFAARLLKKLQRQSCRDFKKCRVRIPIANAFTNFGETARDLVFGNHFAVHANPIAKTDEVRGGEQTSPKTRCSRDCVDQCADGPFTIRASDVNDFTRSGGF